MNMLFISVHDLGNGMYACVCACVHACVIRGWHRTIAVAIPVETGIG